VLLNDIKQFCETTGLPPTKFGRLAVNDPRLVGDLIRGRRVGRSVDDRSRRLMAEYRP
jgi:hypothetical protein